MIRTAILGYGRSGSSLHADPIEKLSDRFSVVAVCDIDPAAQEKAAARFSCPIYDDYHKMLSEVKPDLTVIVTRSSQHAQMTIDCLLAGSNVLVTKPWATNAADAQRMIAAQSVSGKKLMAWLPARFGSDLRRLREIIDSGDIGHVFEIRRSTNTFGLRNDWQTESQYGGGYLLNWGPHLVDQPLQLTNTPVKTVYGEMRQLINPGDVEDDLRVICRTEDGVTVISEFMIAAGSYPTWVVRGDRGTIYVQDDVIRVHKVDLPDTIDSSVYRSQITQTLHEEPVTGKIYGDEYEIYAHIARVMQDEEEYFVPLSEALMLSRILDAARLSSKLGQIVYLS